MGASSGLYCLSEIHLRGRQTNFSYWQTKDKELTERQQRKLINNKHKRRLKGVI